MLKVKYSEKFLKDIKKLKNNKIYHQIKKVCFEEVPKLEDFSLIKHLKKIQGYNNYYRFRIGDYRIGLKLEENTIYMMRVLQRNEIYKYFP